MQETVKRALIKTIPVPNKSRAIDPRFNARDMQNLQGQDNGKPEAGTRLNKPKPVVKDGKKYFPTKEETLAKELVHKYEELKWSWLIN